MVVRPTSVYKKAQRRPKGLVGARSRSSTCGELIGLRRVTVHGAALVG